MASRQESSLDSAIKSAISDLTLSAELTFPLPDASASCSSTPSFSLGPVKVPLGTSTAPGIISPPSRSDLEAIGSSPSQDMTEGQLP